MSLTRLQMGTEISTVWLISVPIYDHCWLM